MLTADLFFGCVAVRLDAAYDSPGEIRVDGPAELAEAFTEWLATATGFAGHLVGYPIATPRNLHAALLSHGERWRVSNLEVDDAAAAEPLPPGAIA